MPSVPYSLEVLKGGSVAGCVEVVGGAFWTFGRHPSCDVVLEHPSCSRLHAVLQLRGDDGCAFVWDAGSTHGTAVNKRPLKPRAYAPLRVGDQIRFGLSTRTYVLQGPQHLMPEEGLSRAERLQLRQLEAAAAQAEDAALRAMALVKARAAAGGHTGGAPWGQDTSEASDFAAAELPDGDAELDWRSYGGKLSDKQELARDKLRRKEATISNLESEIERISAKEGSQQGLTAGQAAQVSRNEARVQVLRAEIEEAEESLNETLRESALARARAAAGGADEAGEDAAATAVAAAAAAKRKRRAAEAAEVAAAGNSDSDEFFDRTAAAGVPKRPLLLDPRAPQAAVETVQSLWVKREAARAALQAALKAAAEAQAQCDARAGNADDALDAFMDDVGASLRRAAAAAATDHAQRCGLEEAKLNRLIALADPSGFYTGPKQIQAPPTHPPAAQAAAAAAVQSVFPSAAPSVAHQDPPPVQADEDGFLNPAALRAMSAPQLRAQFDASASIRAMEAALAGGAAPEQGGLVQVRRPAAPRAIARAAGAAVQPLRRSSTEVADAAAAQAQADVQRLLGGRSSAFLPEEEEEEEQPAPSEQDGAWAAPTGQDGSGRTRLNDLLGY